MKKILLMCFVVTLLTSCKSSFDYYQVYTVKSNLTKVDNGYVFENSDCKMSYDFWSLYGMNELLIENKTDKNMYIALDQSSVVYNGQSQTYYQDYKDIHKMTSMVRSLPIMCIAPHSERYLFDYKFLINELVKQDDKNQAYPEIKSEPLFFSKEDSPIIYHYYIAYSLSPCPNSTELVHTYFYVDSVTNYKARLKNKNAKVGDDKYIDVLKSISSPDKFYKGYYK